VHERGLARARRAHHGDEALLLDGDVDAVEGVDGGLAAAVGAMQVRTGDDQELR
jgi:hypothetical protein